MVDISVFWRLRAESGGLCKPLWTKQVKKGIVEGGFVVLLCVLEYFFETHIMSIKVVRKLDVL